MIIREATLSDACGIARVHIDTWRITYKGIVNDEFLNELSYDKREKIDLKKLHIAGQYKNWCQRRIGKEIGYI